jgi:hypothetical protein
MKQSQDGARRAAEAFLDTEIRVRFPHEVVIVEEAIRDTGDAWIFPYNGRGYLERDDFSEVMAGNTPIAVNKETGVAGFAE